MTVKITYFVFCMVACANATNNATTKIAQLTIIHICERACSNSIILFNTMAYYRYHHNRGIIYQVINRMDKIELCTYTNR
jgi:hypothetical protein